ncbi:Hypothetical_protein [Hexamita inflata]|uniref:Hypothetical_protein n=1 Tax=Hexamita inflata TaxID=28002 RepID=A0AA86UQY4_9EUKA|nr:Hypothetical protein HINF_LOCUS35070 [Hexamita inflata]CAI9947428.1 Hypothetical protein HINF_LOCUS35073 [Hexamita inflata]
MISVHLVYSCYTSVQLSVSQSRSELLFTSLVPLSESTLTSCSNNILNNISIVFLNDLLLPVAQFTKLSSINNIIQLTESDIVSPSFKQAQFNSRNVSFISVQYLDVYFTVHANVIVVGQILNPNADSNQTVVYSVSTAFAVMVLIIVIVVILYFTMKHKQNQLQNKKITKDKMSFETVKGGEMIFSTCKIDNNLSLPGTPRRHTLNRVNSQSKLKTKVNKQKVQKFDQIPPSKLKIQYRAQPKSIEEIEQDKQELENIMSKNAKVAHQLKQYTVHRVDSESIIPLCEVINLSEEQKDEVIQMTSQKELQDFLFAFLSNDQFQSEVDVEEPETSIIINEENDKEPEIVQINDPKLNAIYKKIGLTKMSQTITNEDIITL